MNHHQEVKYSTLPKSKPEKLPSPPRSLDHAEHVVFTALAGHPELAADHLLHKEMKGMLETVVSSIIRRLNLEFQRALQGGGVEENKVKIRQMAFEVMIEISLNLYGIEADLVGFPEEESELVLRKISYTMSIWEELERKEGSSIGQLVVEKILGEMRKVFSGGGMVAKIADEIDQKLRGDRSPSRFVSISGSVLRDNIYYRMVKKRMCKFGNDYAIGLRWLRHLGYVQVSTNPVLAARAYEDDPELLTKFLEETKENHSKWLKDLDAFGDEIAMQATMVALWPNLAIFRPIAILTDFHDGMVSYQLNPNVASSVDGSISDALKIYSAAQEFLRNYDEYLLWGYSKIEDRGRPNIVFKIAGGYPAAVEITSSLNSMGIGTNNTVTYTVAQEVMLIMAAMKGMAEAVKKGILPTQVYETNMGGRLESHLREAEIERIVIDALKNLGERRDALLLELAKGVGALKEIEGSREFEERVRRICSFKYLKSLENDALINVLATARGVPKEEVQESLSRLEGDIGLAGTLVAQRTYEIFFSIRNRPKWIEYLVKGYGLKESEAEKIIDRIDVLPASKRKPNDTYLTLAERNMTNTEFPDHQQRVQEASRREGFNLSSYENAILHEHDKEIIRRLLLLRDFRRAYELTPELNEKLRSVGISGDYGKGGLEITEWASFGSVIKTMTEFTNAYNAFKAKCIEAIKVDSSKSAP
ncbi:MAG: transaldolase family protein [Thermoproteota archaeon]